MGLCITFVNSVYDSKDDKFDKHAYVAWVKRLVWHSLLALLEGQTVTM